VSHSALFGKVYGCMAAGAIGDQLGWPVETWDYERIRQRHGRITDPWADYGKPRKAWDPELGFGTDDMAMALILCRAYLARGGRITMEDFARQWLADFNPEPYFHCMRNTYELLRTGYSPRLTGALNIVTGSAMMAAWPVGVFNAGDPERAYGEALGIASMYQRGLDMFAAGVVAAAVAEAMRPSATTDSVIEAAVRLAPDEPMTTFDERPITSLRATVERAVEIGAAADDVFDVRAPLYEEMLQYKPLDPQEVLALTFGVFRAADGDTEQAVLGGANIGRDSDTIAGINGQICGALNGAGSIPDAWLTGLRERDGHEKLEKIARGMTALLEGRLERLQSQVAQLSEMTK